MNKNIIFVVLLYIEVPEIKDFINQFLKDKHADKRLKNTFYRSTQLNAVSFENLALKTIDFNDFDKNSQWQFYKNQTWHITKDRIHKYRPGEVFKYVWNDEVLDHKVELLDDFFKIYKDEFGDYQIDILNNSPIYLKFLQRTCQMHWRVEEYGVDDGKGGLRKTLTDEEKREHDLHLINKIYAIGYLLHKYKDPSKTLAVWAMENEVIENSKSEGRTGKSLLLKFPSRYIKSEIIGARSQKITDNKHMLENVNEFTSYVLFDDCSPYLDFSYFFPLITGVWNINPKNTKGFSLKETDAPKIAFSSNFAPKDADSSTLARLIFVVFSDYYHFGPTESFAEERTPKDEFEMSLLDDFDEKEWNLTNNFAAQCLKAFLSLPHTMNPPMQKVHQRQLLAQITDVFKEWADVYLSVASGRLNTELVREEMDADFRKSTNTKGTSNKFGKLIWREAM